MNPKIKKLKAERERNVLRITEMTSRNEEIDKQVARMKLEASGVTLDRLTPEQEEYVHGFGG